MSCRAANVALACWLAAAAVGPRAQAALGGDEAKVLWVGGRPLLRATLRAGEKVYYGHLLLDLATTRELYLHRNAAGSLQAEACTVECGGILRADVPFTSRRDTWLEGLTAEFALGQVPVVGIVGLAAFGRHDVVLDGPNAVLRLAPVTAASVPPPPVGGGPVVVPLVEAPDGALRLELDLGGEQRATVALHTRDPFSWLAPERCRAAGHADGVLKQARAGEFDFAAWTPFRPLRAESGQHGGIGGAVLQQLVLTIQPAAQRLLIEAPAAPVYPEVEASFYRAAFGGQPSTGLQQFLTEHGEAPQAGEAAAALFERALERGGEPELLRTAGLAIVRTAKATGRGTAALEVLAKVSAEPAWFALRQEIAAAGLADARADEDGTAVHQLRLELGRLARRSGDAAAARRHLLSAVFGMPTSGAANLELGHWHRERGELDAALARYFLAMLDMRDHGPAGLVAFSAAFAQQRGADADLIAELEDRADGRVPSFQPIPRDAAAVPKTGRTVLVELFTGAMCPPCVAADVACDALAHFYSADEAVVLQWHLPIPAPEPLVSPVAVERAGHYEVGSTPTVVVAGGEPVAGGGRVDAAADLFRSYCERIDAQLRQPPVVQLAGEARCADGVVTADVRVTPVAAKVPVAWRLHAVLAERTVVFPGANGLLFHHAVARAALTPAGGVPAGASPLLLRLPLAEVERDLDDHVAQFEAERPFLVRPVAPAAARLDVVVFVQDERGAVLQALRLPVAVVARAAK
jgi:hypothetical protein